MITFSDGSPAISIHSDMFSRDSAANSKRPASSLLFGDTPSLGEQFASDPAYQLASAIRLGNNPPSEAAPRSTLFPCWPETYHSKVRLDAGESLLLDTGESETYVEKNGSDEPASLLLLRTAELSSKTFPGPFQSRGSAKERQHVLRKQFSPSPCPTARPARSAQVSSLGLAEQSPLYSASKQLTATECSSTAAT
jgi:hypothetical protein